jgi:hypothetical protein
MNNLLSRQKLTVETSSEILQNPKTSTKEKIIKKIKEASIKSLEAKLVELNSRLDNLESELLSQGEDVGKNEDYQTLIEITGLVQDEIRTRLSAKKADKAALKWIDDSYGTFDTIEKEINT